MSFSDRREKKNNILKAVQNAAPGTGNLWDGALEKYMGGMFFKIMGLDSLTQTAFACVVRPQEGPEIHITLGHLVRCVTSECSLFFLDRVREGKYSSVLPNNMCSKMHHADKAASELLSLGAVWILNEPALNGRNVGRKNRRATYADEGSPLDWKNVWVRIHFSPRRFPAFDHLNLSSYCPRINCFTERSAYLKCAQIEVGGEEPRLPDDTIICSDVTGGILYEVKICIVLKLRT